MQTRHRLRPVPALDGVRGLAVAAVVLFHFPTNPAVPGGQFGVDVFFVLSGFLVTAGLLDDADGPDGPLAFGPFIARRAWRLLPALLAFLAVFFAMDVLWGHDGWFGTDPFGHAASGAVPLSRGLVGVGAALLYVYNIAIIQGIRTAVPLAHLWTLAIEGQFYVGWALLLKWLLQARRAWVLRVTLAVVAVSAAAPWLLWELGAGKNAIYFGTLPRLQQLLAGAAVAQIWRRGDLDRLSLRALRWSAAVGGAVLVVICLQVGEQPFKYFGAETVNAAGAAAVVAFLVVAPPTGAAAQALATRPLRWLGTRSYAIYLWHWPMAVWTSGMAKWTGTAVGIPAALVLAELSWRLVEQPAQRLRRRLARVQPGPEIEHPAAAAVRT